MFVSVSENGIEFPDFVVYTISMYEDGVGWG